MQGDVPQVDLCMRVVRGCDAVRIHAISIMLVYSAVHAALELDVCWLSGPGRRGQCFRRCCPPHGPRPIRSRYCSMSTPMVTCSRSMVNHHENNGVLQSSSRMVHQQEYQKPRCISLMQKRTLCIILKYHRSFAKMHSPSFD